MKKIILSLALTLSISAYAGYWDTNAYFVNSEKILELKYDLKKNGTYLIDLDNPTNKPTYFVGDQFNKQLTLLSVKYDRLYKTNDLWFIRDARRYADLQAMKAKQALADKNAKEDADALLTCKNVKQGDPILPVLEAINRCQANNSLKVEKLLTINNEERILYKIGRVYYRVDYVGKKVISVLRIQ